MNLYVSTTELKTYLGISGSAQDALLVMLNKQATDLVNGILGVSDMALHLVTDEIHDAIGRHVYCKDWPIKQVGTILDDGDAYTQDEDYDIQGSQINLEDYLTGGLRKLKVTYVAGYNASGYAKIEINDYTGLAGKKVTLGVVDYTEGSGWTAATSNEATATSLATALDAAASVRAFACGSTVYVIDATEASTDSVTITVNSTNMTLTAFSGKLGGLDFPEGIRAAVMVLVSSMKSKTKSQGVKSYAIGTKRVEFQSETDFQQFKAHLQPYMRARVLTV